MINDPMTIVAARILQCPLIFIRARRLDDDHAAYYWDSRRGGAAIIIGDDRTRLAAGPARDPDAHIREFRAGSRDPGRL